MNHSVHSPIQKPHVPATPQSSHRPAPSAAPAHTPAQGQGQFGHRLSQITPDADSRFGDTAEGGGEATAESLVAENETGLPDGLKAGVESLAGVSLDDVRVHYGSPHPDGLAARAFAQGTDIHVGLGEERHLGHEAWHVVQQKQGRVRPTLQAGGLSLNDDDGLEAEADRMGGRFTGSEGLALPSRGTASAPRSAAPIQLMPKRKAFDKNVTKNTAQNASITNIGDAMDSYHQIKPKHDKDYQGRLGALQDMEKHLYGWFDTHVTDTIDKTPNGAHMKKMLEENQAEHRKLVSKIAKKPNLVPINTTGMQKGEVDSVRQTWRSVVDGTGNLNIKAGRGEGAFKNRQQANVAKLLQHKAGREIITNLSAPQYDPSKKVTIGSGFKKELKAFGRKDPTDSQAVPKTPDGDVTSMAFQRVSRDTLKNGEVPVVNPGDRSSGPQHFNRFLSALPGGTSHFEHEGEAYKLGQGVGSYVKMAGKGGVEANVGTRMQETVVPEFVTLGHELAHSERMMKGTSVPFGEDMEKFGFQGNDTQKRLWNNSEEYVNIAGPENAIRAEHGMAERQFHAGDLDEAKMPLQRKRLDDLLRHPLSAPKNGPSLPGYDELFDTYGKMMLEKSEDGMKRHLMSPNVAQWMDTLEHHIGQAQPVNNAPVNNAPVNPTHQDDSQADDGGQVANDSTSHEESDSGHEETGSHSHEDSGELALI